MPLERVVEVLRGEPLRALAPAPVSRLAAVLEQDESQPYAMPEQDALRAEIRWPDGWLRPDELARVEPHSPVAIPALALLQALTPDETRQLVGWLRA